MQTRWPFLWHLYDELLCNSLTPCQDSVYALAWWCFHNHKVPFRRSIVIYFSCILEKIQKERYIQLELIFFKTKRVLHGMLIRLKSNACDFFSYCPACVHVRVPASTTEPQDTLKTVAYITGKKIQQSKNFLLIFPLKISLQTSVCMHQVCLNWILYAISPLKSFLKLYFNGKNE